MTKIELKRTVTETFSKVFDKNEFIELVLNADELDVVNPHEVDAISVFHYAKDNTVTIALEIN